MREDQPLEILGGCGGDIDVRQTLELVEWLRLPAPSLLEAKLSALERAWDPIEQLDDVAWVDIGLVNRMREQRARQRPFLRVRASGQE